MTCDGTCVKGLMLSRVNLLQIKSSVKLFNGSFLGLFNSEVWDPRDDAFTKPE